MNVDAPVDAARRALLGTGQHAAHLAADLVDQGRHLVEDEVVAPVSRRARRMKKRVRNTVAPPPPRPDDASLVAVAVVAALALLAGVVWWRRRAHGRELEQAAGMAPDTAPDAFGAAVTAIRH